MKRVLGLSLLGHFAGASRVSPVQQVVQMLSEMKTKGESMMHQEQKTYAAYKEWASDQETELGFEMKTAESSIEKLTAFIEQAEAKVADLTSVIAAGDGEISTLEADKATQTKARQAENEEFIAESQDYGESVDALERAIQVLSSQAYSRPQAEMMLQKMARSKPAMRPALAAFLQQTASQNGAPEVAAYEFQSSSIVTMLEDFLEKFKGQLDAANTEEANRAHAYEMAMIHTTNTLTRLNQDREEQAGVKAQTQEASAKAQGELAETKTELAADKAFLADMQATFAAKSSTFNANQGVRKQELEALSKAIEIISNPTVADSYGEHVKLAQLDTRKTSFLQMRSSHRRGDAQRRAADLLRERASALSSETLSALAAKIAANPFEKVIAMIKDLIDKMKEQAAVEADHKAWCDEQLKENKLKREEKTIAVDKISAQIGEVVSEIAAMAADIETLAKEQAELTKSMSEATQVRTKEKASNEDAIADAKAGDEAVKQAIAILHEFYSSQASLLQGRKEVPEMAVYKGMQETKGGVIGMLEVIETDFMRVVAETMAAESQAAMEYDTFIKEAEADKERKHKKEVQMKLDKDQEEFKNSELKKDMKSEQEQLDMANDYYEDLRPQCVEVKVSYEERVARREEELAALNEAYEVLDSHSA